MNQAAMDRLSFMMSGVAAAVGGRGTVATQARAGSTSAAEPIPERVLRAPFIGETRRFDGTVAPAGWAFCEGQILSIASYRLLFSVLGRSAGGTRTTFALPRTRQRTIIAVSGSIPRSPAEIAFERRAEYGSPDISVSGVRVLGRSARTPVRVPVPAPYPPWWPGTTATPAFVREQEREMRAIFPKPHIFRPAY